MQPVGFCPYPISLFVSSVYPALQYRKLYSALGPPDPDSGPHSALSSDSGPYVSK